MAKPIDAHVGAAARLLARAREGAGTAAGREVAAGRVYDALFQSFAPVLGGAGVRALFARSVKLTKTAFPGLEKVNAYADVAGSNMPTADALELYLSELEPRVASEVAVALFANFFGLMTNFIGERLVWQLLKGAFPSMDETLPQETE